MWVLECGEEILLLDCGVMFPEAEMLGVDLVLPDISYLQDKKEQIKAILLTHGHEDHVGAIPHLLADLGFPPIYGTPLTIGIVRLLDRSTLVRFQSGEKLSIGSFTIEPFHVAHSIPDTVGFGITTPAGLVVYLTDWKFDHTPVDGRPTDMTMITELGRRSPLALITDCVRVESLGYTPSEQVVGEAFDNIFATAPGHRARPDHRRHLRVEYLARPAGDRLGRGLRP
jgi:ribonuclease J